LVLVQGVAFGGIAWLYWRYRDEWVGSLFGFPDLRDVLAAVAAYGASLGGAMVGAVVITVLGLEAGRNNAATTGAEAPEVLLVLVVASFVLIGPGEEILFRGVVQRRLREAFGPVVAVVVAAVAFAAVHVIALSGGLGARGVTIGVLLLPSIAFGAAYEYTDNLTVPAFVHGAYDATLFSVLYLLLKLAELGYAPSPTG
jgi:membrane protease YdiL (CAAX protease family)